MTTATRTHLRHDDGTLCCNQLCASSSMRPHRAAHAEMFYVGETLQQRLGQHPGLRFHRIGRETFDPPAVPLSLTQSLSTGMWTLVVTARSTRPCSCGATDATCPWMKGDTASTCCLRCTHVPTASGLRREWIVGGGFGVHVSWPL